MAKVNKAGTIIKIKIAEKNNPPMTTEPKPLYNSEPAPGNNTNGNIPNILVNVDIKIGLTLVLADSKIASILDIFFCLIKSTVCSTNKIELLTTIPIKIRNPSNVNISRA